MEGNVVIAIGAGEPLGKDLVLFDPTCAFMNIKSKLGTCEVQLLHSKGRSIEIPFAVEPKTLGANTTGDPDRLSSETTEDESLMTGLYEETPDHVLR